MPQVSSKRPDSSTQRIPYNRGQVKRSEADERKQLARRELEAQFPKLKGKLDPAKTVVSAGEYTPPGFYRRNSGLSSVAYPSHIGRNYL